MNDDPAAVSAGMLSNGLASDQVGHVFLGASKDGMFESQIGCIAVVILRRRAGTPAKLHRASGAAREPQNQVRISVAPQGVDKAE